MGPRATHSLDLNTSSSYDEDFNHEPCQKKGHKAHWAVSAGASTPPLPHVLLPELLPTVNPAHTVSPLKGLAMH